MSPETPLNRSKWRVAGEPEGDAVGCGGATLASDGSANPGERPIAKKT